MSSPICRSTICRPPMNGALPLSKLRSRLPFIQFECAPLEGKFLYMVKRVRFSPHAVIRFADEFRGFTLFYHLATVMSMSGRFLCTCCCSSCFRVVAGEHALWLFTIFQLLGREGRREKGRPFLHRTRSSGRGWKGESCKGLPLSMSTLRGMP